MTDDISTGLIRALIIDDELDPRQSLWLGQILVALTPVGKAKLLQSIINEIIREYDFALTKLEVPSETLSHLNWLKYASQTPSSP